MGGTLLLDDLVGLVFYIVLDFMTLVFGEEAGDFFTTNIGGRPDGELAVAMLADLISMDRLRMDFELMGETKPEAGGVKDGAATDDTLGREVGDSPGKIAQDVHGIRYDNENTVKAGFDNGADNVLSNTSILLEKVGASFARFLVRTSGEDADIAVLSCGIIAGTNFEPAGRDGKGVRQVKDFAFGVILVNIS